MYALSNPCPLSPVALNFHSETAFCENAGKNKGIFLDIVPSKVFHNMNHVKEK